MGQREGANREEDAMSSLCEARVTIVTGARRGGLLDRGNDLAGGPREAMEIDDFLQAAAVLTQWLATAATATVT
jgi:hypothetical protein